MKLLAVLAALVLAAAGGFVLWKERPWQPPQPTMAPAPAADDIISRGEYLARAGDCMGCHTAPGGHPFAGLRTVATPFGNIHTPNITPDDETGIGRWTADDFYRMMQTGLGKDGRLLYPAMPFANYTRVTRADSDAIYAFLMSVPPVRQPNRPHELRLGSDPRELLLGWRTLHFRQGEYQPDRLQTEEWNRGAYLVQGLGHCSMCHTTAAPAAGSRDQQAFSAGMVPHRNWFVPSLASNREAGLGEWKVQDIVELLQTGVSRGGTAYGPMAGVIFHSLQYLRDEDVRAMAVYLKSLPPRGEARPASQAHRVPPPTLELGRKVYTAQCAMCHGDEGKGFPPHLPPLAGNRSIEMASPVNPVRMILDGGYAPVTRRNPRPYGMPPFAHLLDDEHAAAVATYIRVAWGNGGAPVTAAQVQALRSMPAQ